jgi:hypothetical protein
VPAADAIVLRRLAKSPAERYQQADEIVTELEALGSRARQAWEVGGGAEDLRCPAAPDASDHPRGDVTLSSWVASSGLVTSYPTIR